MAIKIKRSSGNSAPAELAAGQLAYAEGSSNGGTLYYGEIGGTVREIGGRKFVDKLNGIEAGAQVNTVTSVAGRTGAVTITSSDLSDFNTAVDGRITSSAVTGALGYTPISSTEKGANNGVATLDSAGKVPSSQLPSYVDDVVEGANLAAFPATGEADKIYVALDTGKTYRWSGSTYVEISASPGSTDSVTEGSTNKYFTTERARQSVSASSSGDGSLSYSESTGVFTYTGPGDADYRAAISVTQNLSYNSSTGVITGPDLTGYATSSSLATVATTGSYNDLSNKPTLFSGSYTDLTDKPTLFSGDYNDLSNKPSLATVATSGSYNDLINKPTLFSGSYTDLTNKPTIPTTVGELTNDSGFISEVVQDTTPQLGGDLDMNGKKIVTTNNASITLAPNGTGGVIINETGTGGVVSRRTSSNSANTFVSNALIAQRNYTGGTLSTMDGQISGVAFSVRDSAAAQSTFARVGAQYFGDGSHNIGFEISSNNFTTSKRVVILGEGGISIGDPSATAQQSVTTTAAQDLVINTNQGTDSGSITIINGANGDIEISPNGTGHVVISGLSYPATDGSANQVLKTDGSGNLSWVTQTAGVTAFTGLSDVPSSFSGSGGYYVKVNSGATALEFSQDVDDGTF